MPIGRNGTTSDFYLRCAAASCSASHALRLERRAQIRLPIRNVGISPLSILLRACFSVIPAAFADALADRTKRILELTLLIAGGGVNAS